MSELMGKNAGLIEGGVTDTFCQYQAHLDLLKAASETKAPKDAKEGWQEFGYYPRLLNREVREGYKLVIRNLERLQDAADTTLCKLLGLEYRDYRQAVRKLLENVSYYEKNVKAYAIRFDSFDLTPLRRRFTGHIKPKTQDDGPPTILEVGAGTGRDCAAFINDGFVVKAFDITPAMVRECNRKIRFIRDNGISEDAKMRARESNCIELSFDEMSYRNEFDGVWASASLLHVPKSDFPTILHAMLGALRPKGVLFMSFKYGIGEHEFDSRHYSYFRRREICHMVDGLREASVIEIWITDSKGNDLGPLRSFAASVGNYFNRNSANWVNVLLRKSAP
jgi:SAM-dependent methyltransferase